MTISGMVKMSQAIRRVLADSCPGEDTHISQIPDEDLVHFAAIVAAYAGDLDAEIARRTRPGASGLGIEKVVTSEWSVVDAWWTDSPVRREYRAFRFPGREDEHVEVRVLPPHGDGEWHEVIPSRGASQ